MSERPPAALLEAVRADARAVRPLPPPWRRALALAPLGCVVAALAPLAWGLRQNLHAIGPLAGWGLSALQALVGFFVVGAALREAVPGRTLSWPRLLLVVVGGVGVEVGITLLTSGWVPAIPRPDVWVRFVWECFGQSAAAAVPLVVASGWLASRVLPERPAITGALYGLGSGLVADSGVRLFCWVSEPAHVLVAHGGAILAMAAAGAAATVWVERRRARADRGIDWKD
jgi:hypothetical protein